MSFCRNCGTETDIVTGLCPKCSDNNPIDNSVRKKQNVLATVALAVSIIAFVSNLILTVCNFTFDDLGFLWAWILCIAVGIPASLICLTLSVVSLCITLREIKQDKCLAIAGLILSALSSLMSIVVFFYPFFIKLLA